MKFIQYVEFIYIYIFCYCCLFPNFFLHIEEREKEILSQLITYCDKRKKWFTPLLAQIVYIIYHVILELKYPIINHSAEKELHCKVPKHLHYLRGSINAVLPPDIHTCAHRHFLTIDSESRGCREPVGLLTLFRQLLISQLGAQMGRAWDRTGHEEALIHKKTATQWHIFQGDFCNYNLFLYFSFQKNWGWSF